MTVQLWVLKLNLIITSFLFISTKISQIQSPLCLGKPPSKESRFYFFLIFSLMLHSHIIARDSFSLINTLVVHALHMTSKILRALEIISSRILPWLKKPKKQQSLSCAFYYKVNKHEPFPTWTQHCMLFNDSEAL